MSDESDSSLARTLVQAQNATSGKSDTTDELVMLACAILRMLLLWLTSETAHRIGQRLGTLSQAAFVPPTGHGNFQAAASLMGMSERGMEEMVSRRNVPTLKPGSERIIRFADLLQTFDPPTDTDPQQPGEMLRPRCAKKKPSVPARQKPKKK